MTRVLFCNPPCHGIGNDGKPFWFVRAGSRWPFSSTGHLPAKNVVGHYSPSPLFLQYAASYAQAAGAEVDFRDSIALRDSYPEFYRYAEELRPEYVVLESATPSWEHDQRVLQTLDALIPHVKLILTGPICASEPGKTSQGERAVERGLVHAALKGEYEKGVVKVLNGARGVLDFDFLTAEEMNAAPFPWLDEQHAYKYWDSNPKGQQWPQAQVWSSRGCIYKCLAGETLVETRDGQEAIKDLVGKEVQVWALDMDAPGIQKDNRLRLASAVNIRQYGTSNLVRVHLKGGEHLDCTPDHTFKKYYSTGDEGPYPSIAAEDLKFGEKLIGLDKRASRICMKTVMNVERLPGVHPVYCLTVPETGWFFANDLLTANCIFCVWPAVMTGNDPTGSGVRKTRNYTGAYMEALLTRWKARFPNFNCVYDDSDMFNFGDKHTLDVSAAYKRVGLPWSAMCRIDTVKWDTWRQMKEDGCFGVKVGIESAVKAVNDNIVHKQLDLHQAAKTFRYLQSLGMTMHTTFTMGLPGETKAQIGSTLLYIEWLKRQGLTQTYQLSGTAEIEGTPLSSLGGCGTLPKYPGARVDANYEACSDGNEKLRRLTLPLT